MKGVNSKGCDLDLLPEVSVVVLNYDGKSYLEDCFRSLEQTLNYPRDRLQLIMVDNGSTDGSVEYMRDRFPHVKIIRNSRNLGFAKANNIGAEQAKGKYVAFINNDARAHPDWLIELVKSISKEEDVVCVGGKILSWDGSKIDFIGGALNFYSMGFQPSHGQPNGPEYSESKEILFACGGSMLVERELFLDCGGFDEGYFAYFEDVDLGWRLWVLGYRVLFVPTAISYHRGLGTSSKFATEKRSTLYERNALYSIIKNYEEENLLRILPVALLLTVRRAVIFSHVSKNSYRMDMIEDPSMIWPASPEPRGLAKMKLLGHELHTALREYGAWMVSKELVRRALRWFYVRWVRWFRGDLDVIGRHGVSHLVAMDDVIENLPSVMAKRGWIQTRRKRADSEIFPLFVTPFHPHPPYPDYERVQQRLAEYMGVYEIFEKGGYETPHR